MSEKGFTLIEVLVSIVILTMLIVGMMTVIPQSGKVIVGGKNRTTAVEAAQTMIDSIKSMEYEAIPVSNNTNFDLSSTLSGIASATPSGALVDQLAFMTTQGNKITPSAVEYIANDGSTFSTLGSGTLYIRKTQVLWVTGGATVTVYADTGTATDMKQILVKVWKQKGTTNYSPTNYPSAEALTSQTTLIKRM